MSTRATLIKLVHAGARQLFDSDDDRRAWQRTRTGCDSCTDMTDAQLDALVGELRRKGALHKRPPRKAGRVPFNRSPYMTKIEALLADMGLSWQYAESIAWRITGGKGLKPGSEPGVERLEWVRDARSFRGIIAALEVEQKKRRAMATITRQLDRLGCDLAFVDNLVHPSRRGVAWQRHLPTLEAVRDQLYDLIARRRDEGAE